MLPLALTLLAAAMLVSIGGRYTWPTIPCVVAAAAMFIGSGARVGADPATRPVDLAIGAALAVAAIQLVPLPPNFLAAISPATARLQNAYALESLTGWRPLSVHPALTRMGLALGLAAAFVFWAARDAFARGGSRAAIQLLAWIGFACALVSLAQTTTAPTTILWKWTVPDPRARPIGPFVDRNQLATWLVLTIGIVTGYLVMRTQAHMADRLRSGWRAMTVELFDGGGIAIAGCLGAMLIALAATLSRSGLIAMVVSAVVGASLWRGERAFMVRTGMAAGVALIALAAWLNMRGLVERIVTTVAPADPNSVGRLQIWRDTLRIARDFPFFGTGVGTFADAMFVYQQTAREVLFNHAHDEYLQLLTEGGLTLLAITLVGVVFLGRAAVERLKQDRGPHRAVRVGACAALAGIAVQSIWETGLRAPANLLLAAILAALAVRPLAQRSGEASREMPAT